MAPRKVTGTTIPTALSSKDKNFDIGQLVSDLVLGDSLNGNTVTIGTDGSVTITGPLVIPTKTPSSASDTGTTGEIAWDADYIYVCVDTDTWVRAAIATWV